MRLPCLLVAAAIALPLPHIALADGPAPLRQIEASRVAYDAGIANDDPLLVLAAAKLRRGTDLQEADRTPDEIDAGTGTGADTEFLTWQSMVEEARALARGDPAMLGVIDDMVDESTKGVVIGPVYNRARLGPKGRDVYGKVPFKGREYAEIYVEARGPQDLNLFVYDAQNRLVCSDTDPSAIAYCGWTPRKTGDFSIRVENASGASAAYALITN